MKLRNCPINIKSISLWKLPTSYHIVSYLILTLCLIFLRNLHHRFDWHYIGQIYGEDFAKFCGLLTIYELYRNMHVLKHARANSNMILYLPKPNLTKSNVFSIFFFQGHAFLRSCVGNGR